MELLHIFMFQDVTLFGRCIGSGHLGDQIWHPNILIYEKDQIYKVIFEWQPNLDYDWMEVDGHSFEDLS